MNLLKYVTTSIAIVCLASILAGCGGSINTPEGVVQKQINALKKLDINALMATVDVDETSRKEIISDFARIPEKNKKALMTVAGHIKIISSEIKEDKAIVVVSVPAPGRGEDLFNLKELRKKEIRLVNKNGKWLTQFWFDLAG